MNRRRSNGLAPISAAAAGFINYVSVSKGEEVMNQMSKPQNVDVAAGVARHRPLRRGKRQRRVMRFFEPHFAARGLGPLEVDDAMLRQSSPPCRSRAAKAYFKQPDVN